MPDHCRNVMITTRSEKMGYWLSKGGLLCTLAVCAHCSQDQGLLAIVQLASALSLWPIQSVAMDPVVVLRASYCTDRGLIRTEHVYTCD